MNTLENLVNNAKFELAIECENALNILYDEYDHSESIGDIAELFLINTKIKSLNDKIEKNGLKEIILSLP